MKKTIITYLFFVLHNINNAQVNLVPNGNFETYTQCPNGSGEISTCTDWSSYCGSADYFNTCADFSTGESVPKNTYGFQPSINGNAYAGIITYYSGSFFREILGHQLSIPLTIGQKYYVSFRTCSGDTGFVVGYNTNKLGVNFSTISFTNYAVKNIAKIYKNSIITDTLNWVKFFGSFTADSAYKHIMIGNFFDDGNTNIVQQASGTFAYYYIDDVCLSTDSTFTSNYVTNTKQNAKNNPFKIYYDERLNVIVVENYNGIDISNITLYNFIGAKLNYYIESEGNTTFIHCSNLSQNIVIVNIDNFLKKLIINK